METQDIIKRSSRWRVGDGNSIQIWKDLWLLDQSNPKVLTTPFPYLEEANVSSLMNMHGTYWDVDIIQDIFEPRDANLIMNIHLSMQKRSDKLIWAKENRGNFTIKSCYKALTVN